MLLFRSTCVHGRRALSNSETGRRSRTNAASNSAPAQSHRVDSTDTIRPAARRRLLHLPSIHPRFLVFFFFFFFLFYLIFPFSVAAKRLAVLFTIKRKTFPILAHCCIVVSHRFSVSLSTVDTKALWAAATVALLFGCIGETRSYAAPSVSYLRETSSISILLAAAVWVLFASLSVQQMREETKRKLEGAVGE